MAEKEKFVVLIDLLLEVVVLALVLALLPLLEAMSVVLTSSPTCGS